MGKCFIAWEQKHEKAWNECRHCQKLNRDGTVRTQHVEKATKNDWSDCPTDGERCPAQRVESGKLSQAEIAAQQVRRHVTLTAHAETDQNGGSQSHGQSCRF